MNILKEKVQSHFVYLRLTISILACYIMSNFLFNDFININNLFYLRLLFPTIILFACLVIVKKIFKLIKSAKVYYCDIYNGLLTLILFVIILNLVSAIKIPALQFDTWQVYDTSKYTFIDFGKMDMMRQHLVQTPYQMAFPPIFPILMAIFNLFFNFEVFSAVMVNFLVVFLILLYILKIGNYINKIGISLLIGSLLLLNPHMIACYM